MQPAAQVPFADRINTNQLTDSDMALFMLVLAVSALCFLAAKGPVRGSQGAINSQASSSNRLEKTGS